MNNFLLKITVRCDQGEVNHSFTIEDINDIKWRGSETSDSYFLNEFETDEERFYARVRDLADLAVERFNDENECDYCYLDHEFEIEDDLPDLASSIEWIIANN